MTGEEIDYWNQSVSASYTVTLNDTMTVTSGNQELSIWAESSLNDVNSTLWIWNVEFINSTYFWYWVNSPFGSANGPHGYLNCVNGIVYVVVSGTSIEFTGGVGEVTVSIAFQNLVQIQTQNDGGDFTSGNLNIGIQ